jgi:HEAT repeat protein
MLRFSPGWLVALALLGVSLSGAADVEPADEKILRENKVPTEGPALLEFLRKRFTEMVSDDRLKELIEQLGDESFARREEASKQLILLGQRAKRHLQAARGHADLEVRSRAQTCLGEIDKNGGLSVQVHAAAVRVLARAKPAGTARLLLGLLPDIADDALAGEVRDALADLAMKDGKPEPVLIEGLKDRLAVKRAAAAVALCRAKASDHLPAIRKLLDDPDSKVRLNVALALVRLRHKEAMPVLLALMDQPTTRETGLVEDMLFRLAGDKSPVLADRSERYRKDWETWWKEHGSKIDLAALEESARVLGHTTVVLLDLGAVVDLDATNRVRWRIDKLEQPLDVQRLNNERVLVAEHRGNRVTERNSKGEILWQKRIAEPLTAQRLANGNTFIANRFGLVEVDRAGKEVFAYNRPNGEEIMRARKLPGGDILLITQLGVTRFVRLDRFGKEIKSFGVEVATSGGRIDLTPAGNVLIPELHQQRVVERDMDGRVMRELVVQQPITAAALPNGHVLVTSMSQKRAIEFDRAGREVWEYRRDSRVTRAVRH